MYHIRRKLFSQNFLHNRKLVSKLIRNSSIGKNDLVLEIGAGKGIITEVLLAQAQHVLAMEIDIYWHKYLRNRFKDAKNLTLYQDDILSFKLPSLPYKVFANIPFSIEGKIVRYLIEAKNPPIDCYLVVMKELGYRFSAPYRENWFSFAHKPWFDFSIYHEFRRTDFIPSPNVDSVMLRFKKRTQPLLPWAERERYLKFLRCGFGQGEPVWKNLSKVYGRERAARLLSAKGLGRRYRPTELSLETWVSLYLHFIRNSTK